MNDMSQTAPVSPPVSQNEAGSVQSNPRPPRRLERRTIIRSVLWCAVVALAGTFVVQFRNHLTSAIHRIPAANLLETAPAASPPTDHESQPHREAQTGIESSSNRRESPGQNHTLSAATGADTRDAKPAMTVPTETPTPPAQHAPVPRPRPAVKFDLGWSAMEERLKSTVEYLASDELEGRGIRGKGLDLAAEYVAAEFQRAGLKTDHYGGTPFHEFQLWSAPRKGSVLELNFDSGDSNDIHLRPQTDFTVLTHSPQGRFLLPVSFVGYGISAPELGYDDYAHLQVRGHALIVLRNEPKFRTPRTGLQRTEHSEHAYISTKIRNAIAHGAAAVILCNNSERPTTEEGGAISPDRQPEPDATAADGESLLRVELDEGDISDNIPVVHCRRSAIERLLRDTASGDLGGIESQIDGLLRPQSFQLSNVKATGKVDLVRSGRILRNVVGSLEGVGAHAEETIVVGAHYDHVGRGEYGSLSLGTSAEVHNGADDNASGVAVLLEIARHLAALPKPLGRRVLFIGFTAEELGLIGSKRYVKDPLVPLKQTVAMLNLDMVGRLRNEKLTIYGVDTATEWPGLLSTSGKANRLQISTRPGGYGPSDHASFYEHGVPVLHFFTGYHPQYHRPSDDTALINVDGMARVAAMVSDIVVQLADNETRLHPTTVESEMEVADLDFARALSPRSKGGATPLRLGVFVEKDPNGRGLLVRRFAGASPAQRQGIRVGDVIVKVDNQPVKTLEELQKRVEMHRPGEDVTVELDRQGIAAELVVRLES